MWLLVDAPIEDKMLITDGTSHYAAEGRYAYYTGAIFIADIIVDGIFVLRHYPALGDATIVFHHGLFLLCGCVSFANALYPFPLAWLLMGEASTIFLNVRWWLITTDRGDGRAIKLTCWALALTFGLTRCVLFLWGVSQIRVDVAVAGGANKTAAMLVASTLPVAGVLNLVWFTYIVPMAWRGGKSRKMDGEVRDKEE